MAGRIKRATCAAVATAVVATAAVALAPGATGDQEAVTAAVASSTELSPPLTPTPARPGGSGVVLVSCGSDLLALLIDSALSPARTTPRARTS